MIGPNQQTSIHTHVHNAVRLVYRAHSGLSQTVKDDVFNVHCFFSIVPVMLVVAVVAVLAAIALLLYYSRFLLKHSTMIDLAIINSSPFTYWYKFIGDLVSVIAGCKYTQFYCM